MDGLVEWYHGENGGLQIFENSQYAGHNTLTLLVSNIETERARVQDNGLNPGDIEHATTTKLLRLRDPDDNLVVLAEAV